MNGLATRRRFSLTAAVCAALVASACAPRPAVEPEGVIRPTRPTGSIRRPNGGHLVDGALFVPFPGVRVANPDRVFGTDETVALLTRAIVETQANSPGAPDLLMGDISIDGGGPLSPHRSHQSGRDVDIALYKLNGKFESSFKTATPETLDVATTWLFIETLLLTDRVQYIFLDSTLADALRRHVGLAFSGERLSTWFQFPRKRGTRAGVIRHASGHRDHMHIRFHCPPADYWCVD